MARDGHVCLNGDYNEEDLGWPEHDGRGIFLTYVCGLCQREKLSKYDPRILRASYEADDLGDDDEALEYERDE